MNQKIAVSLSNKEVMKGDGGNVIDIRVYNRHYPTEGGVGVWVKR